MGFWDLVYPSGSTSPGLPQKLARNNLISSPDTFRLYSPNGRVAGLITGARHAVAGVRMMSTFSKICSRLHGSGSRTLFLSIDVFDCSSFSSSGYNSQVKSLKCFSTFFPKVSITSDTKLTRWAT